MSMLRGGMSSRNFFGRIGLVFVISAIFLTITAAGANAAGFSFVDSVKEFLGFAPTQTAAPIVQTAEPISAPAVEPMAPFSAFTAGNLVVYRVGDGSASLNANAAAVFLDEYTASGALVQSIAMPTAVSGSNKRLTASG